MSVFNSIFFVHVTVVERICIACSKSFKTQRFPELKERDISPVNSMGMCQLWDIWPIRVWYQNLVS